MWSWARQVAAQNRPERNQWAPAAIEAHPNEEQRPAMTHNADSHWHPDALDEQVSQAERREMLATVDRFIVKHYGERCREVLGGCSTCAAWAARDVLNATTFEG